MTAPNLENDLARLESFLRGEVYKSCPAEDRTSLAATQLKVIRARIDQGIYGRHQTPIVNPSLN